ncbi:MULTISPECIES: lantibiotic dehydratase [Clostridium]|uniref:lantibiotic dehydratase n=1 Tax=Clostridium TaxID=1485 RepID=UPI0008240ADA|nr:MULTISPECIES: lantibiotic dehydratase [Clostridium]PJI07957.1 hypothetical protein CUB90_08785 [Clostridium sp. CT7]
MNKEDYYDVLDEFITRVPTLSFNNCTNIGDMNHIKNIIAQESFREAIKVASTSLYESIDKKRFNDKVIKSIMKYYSRIMTRTTPFGLFSGVSIGRFGEKSRVAYNEKNIKKRMRVDYEWLSKLIKEIEVKYEGYKKLTLYSSKLIEKYGNKVKNQMLTCFNFNDKVRRIGQACYINNTPNVIFILSLLRNGAKYEDILNAYKYKNINIQSEVIDKFLVQLIKNEYIYTELRPPLSEFNTLEYVISRIESNNIKCDKLQELKKISSLINKYNKLGKESGTSTLNEIEILMKKVVVDAKSLIQVDATNPFEISLDENIRREVIDVSNFLVAFAKKFHSNDSLDRFKNEFIEKYGQYREIPILEVMDPTFGIGYECDDGENDYRYISDELLKNNFIKQKIINAISSGDDAVFTEEDIEIYGNKNIDTRKLPISMEMYCSVISKDISQLMKGKYRLRIGANLGSSGAGKSLGRFSDLLDDSKLMYKNIKKKENALVDNEFIQCELFNLDINPRLTNVSVTKNFRDFQVNAANTVMDSTVKNIDISDIYIGLDEENLYLKSKKYDKKIKVTTNHMLNASKLNKVTKLMRDISDGNEVLSPFSFISYVKSQEIEYMPRIRYKNTILVDRTWRIYKSKFKSTNITYGEFTRFLEEFRNKYMMPDLVYIKNSDLLLLIDLSVDKFKQILFDEFKKEDNSIILQAADLTSKWLSNNKKYYTNEFVFQFVKNTQATIPNEKFDSMINRVYPTKSNYKKLRINNVKPEVRSFGILSNWIYLKIYNNIERANELLGIELNKFIVHLEKKGLIKKWFYIRYRNDKDHIRLRLNICALNNYIEVLKEISILRYELKQKKLADKIVLDEYEREIERYGGEKLIDSAEEVFETHSIIISEFFRLTKNKQLKFDETEFAVCNVINLMNLIGIKYDTQLAIFNCIINKDFMRKEFSANRRRYVDLFNCDNEWSNLRKDNSGELVYSMLNIRKDSVIKFGELLNEIDERGELTNSKFDILMSLIHMFCNRLYGIDKEQENKVRAFTRHALYALRYIKKNKIIVS